MSIFTRDITGWYSVTLLGWVVLLGYIFTIVFILNEQYWGVIDFLYIQISLLGMGVVIFMMMVARLLRQQPFAKGNNTNRGFSLIELLIAISIIGILASISIATFSSIRNSSYEAKTKAEFRSVEQSLELFFYDNDGVYPADTDRDVPPGLESYLAPGIWPDAPYPGSVYDWDNWSPSQLDDDPKEQVYQISVRFCPIGGSLSECNFPDEDWAQDFGLNSALYYCIEGPCRSHSDEAYDYPGHCINCDE